MPLLTFDGTQDTTEIVARTSRLRTISQAIKKNSTNCSRLSIHAARTFNFTHRSVATLATEQMCSILGGNSRRIASHRHYNLKSVKGEQPPKLFLFVQYTATGDYWDFLRCPPSSFLVSQESLARSSLV